MGVRNSPSLLLTLALLSCTSSQPSESPHKQTDAVGSPAEARCLADARAPRSPDASAPERMFIAHILVRHRELSAPQGSTRTRGEACLRALAALEALQGGATWNRVVDEYSDSGQATHGELGRVSKDELSPAFGDAAFSLATQELSYVVESDRGFHIILRTD